MHRQACIHDACIMLHVAPMLVIAELLHNSIRTWYVSNGLYGVEF